MLSYDPSELTASQSRQENDLKHVVELLTESSPTVMPEGSVWDMMPSVQLQGLAEKCIPQATLLRGDVAK